MVGAAVVRRLATEGCEVLTADRSQVDLTRQDQVEAYLASARPDVIVLAAAKVGGIKANDTYPADFLFENLAIETNVIHGAHRAGVAKLLFLGSSCIYPRDAAQPITEPSLLTGPLEPTNEWYAVAKIAGLKLCQAYRRQYGCDFISAMPTNIFGPGDNFHPENSHVPAALLSRFDAAARSGAVEVSIWGTGTPRREFLWVDDLADACVFLLQHYSDEGHVNVGTGQDVTINDFAAMIADLVGYQGAIVHDLGRPDGTPRKLLDVSRLASLGWVARTSLRDALRLYFDWYRREVRKD